MNKGLTTNCGRITLDKIFMDKALYEGKSIRLIIDKKVQELKDNQEIRKDAAGNCNWSIRTQDLDKLAGDKLR